MAEKQYDLVVIGAGSGMTVVQYAAASLGWKCALVEKGPLGGTCLNRGCIPSKRLLHSADIAETVRQSARFGVKARIDQIDFAAIVRNANEYVDRQAAAMERAMKDQDAVGYYKGEGAFLSPHELRVGDERITARRFVVAAGCRPLIPTIDGLDEVDFWTSDQALRPPAQPRTMIILGGGYIAVELAHFYGSMGTEVTIVQRSPRLLSREDEEIAEVLTEIFADRYRVLTGTEVNRVSQAGDGRKKVTVTSNGKTFDLEADTLLVATGLQPNSDILKLENTEMEMDQQGYIKTDQHLATTQKDAWALGDIIGQAPFKHAANQEALVLARNLAGGEKFAMDYSAVPRAIFCSPQIASVGLTEQEARARQLKYEVRKFSFTDTAMGDAMGEDRGFIKYLLLPEKGRIVGCHIIGAQASILIHEVIVAMASGAGVNALLSAIHIHPSLSEVVQWGL
ncbi:dihydrolipoyl dehydrogenase family protein [Desulfurivibrio alkaliphilus]|uniref:Dihydrolipoyl dehydrogenase n=1 Tax=Desulfurivibrio alkaliphilus (strain DSM 19089 / UNIQEM U267 / AHT2) TaxID=589865 RepID=D6Z113_DESAT|nr:dihydrolipoyl dehydrogenase [Desulfurivibrio alkaliphilus]ADH87273.1 FAD-dependent pyridine nucleotide-disulfide oxidoreductase [Desulfurivibrio alkaliphilus AHT 2]